MKIDELESPVDSHYLFIGVTLSSVYEYVICSCEKFLLAF